MRKAQSHRYIGAADQSWAVLGLPLCDDVCREIEIAFVSGYVVQFHNRFEHGRTCHATVQSAFYNLGILGLEL